MLTSGLISLATGIVLGLGTKWGLLRCWWVAVKFVLTIVLCALILMALQPGMDPCLSGRENLRGLARRARVPRSTSFEQPPHCSPINKPSLA